VVEAVQTLDPEVPVYDARTMEDRVGDSLLRQRILMTLLVLFSAIALTLATVGLYGVLSFTVATHSRELAIRKAVGASRRDLYWLVLRGGAIVVGLGVALGAAAAIFATRLLEGLLYGVCARDALARRLGRGRGGDRSPGELPFRAPGGRRRSPRGSEGGMRGLPGAVKSILRSRPALMTCGCRGRQLRERLGIAVAPAREERCDVHATAS
jgi:hypothetical protein